LKLKLEVYSVCSFAHSCNELKIWHLKFCCGIPNTES
ncbi:MAG: hypothetical protein ACI87V_001498, partial [Flavobacteriales bacterium]